MVCASDRRGSRWLVVGTLLLLVIPFTPVDADPVFQDDAGSGQDAPGTISKDITIRPDVIYDGSSPGPGLDSSDAYHFTADAGQRFEGWFDGQLGCYQLRDAAGVRLADLACSYTHALNTGPITTDLPYTGDYYLQVSHLAPAIYRFGYSLTGAAPDVRTVGLLLTATADDRDATPLPMPDGCDDGWILVDGSLGPVERFTDSCYHMRTGLNALDTPDIDVLIVPPVSAYPERDLRTMRQAIEMWSEGIHTLAPQMDMQWLSDGVSFDIFVDDDQVSTDPLWDPEIVVVASNPVGGAGIGIDPLDFVFGSSGPCHSQPNPLASLDDWQRIDGFDSHHDGLSGTFSVECEGGGSLCFAVNGAIDPAPGTIDFFGLFDLVAHEVGHCLTVGHVGDANDHEADAVPFADIMAYTDRSHDKCVSTLDVEGFAIAMSRHLLDTPLAANDADSPHGAFQIQHPDDHRYASPSGLAKDCPQPDAGLVPGGTGHLQDDAGSGGDAPGEPVDLVTIQPDRVYRGTSTGPVLDGSDYYHFTAQAGQVFQGWADGSLGCYRVRDAQGNQVGDHACSYEHAPINTGPMETVLPNTGDYYFQVAHLAPAAYHFGFSLTGSPPSVRLIDQV